MIHCEQIHPAVPADWDALIAALPDAHVLQSAYWADVKGMNGWRPEFLVWKDDSNTIIAAVCIHRKFIPVLGKLSGLSLMYAPRGPILDWGDFPLCSQVITDLQNYATKNRAIFLKIDPQVVIGTGIPEPGLSNTEPDNKTIIELLEKQGWHYSPEQLQFKNTVLLDISQPENVVLEKCKQKTRYNIRLAERKGIKIEPAADNELSILYQMYAETAARDGFIIRTREYYLSVWRNLIKAGIAYPLVAKYESQILSGLVLFIFGSTAYYFYGMSSDRMREAMPNHLLQWEAIRLAKSLGCDAYDFWGAPDTFNSEDRMNGVFRFKEGFNGTVVRGLGAWDFPAMPAIYNLYVKTLPKILDVMRSFGRKRIAKEAKA